MKTPRWELLELLTAGNREPTFRPPPFLTLFRKIEIIVLCYRHVLFFILLKSFLKSKIYHHKNFRICILEIDYKSYNAG